MRVEHVLQRLAEQICTLDIQIQNLRRTRDLLLPRLLSGAIKLVGESEPDAPEVAC